MKKYMIIIGLFLFFFCLYIPVNAEEYKIGKLIPIEEKATVHTEKFDYIDFSYTMSDNENNDGLLSFDVIRNNNITKTAVSFNILLFGKDKTNIGFVSYCSDKTFGEKSGFKLKGGEEVPYSIFIDSTYLIDGKSAKDVFYISVYDDNRFCHSGEKDKYASQTIAQIMEEEEEKPFDNIFSSFLQNKKLIIVLIIIIGSIIFLSLFGLILSSLYSKMYTHSTILAYLPILNFFICVKMAFGTIVAFIYLGLLIVAIVLLWFQIPILIYILLGFTIVAFLIVLIKLFTNKHNLFYLEPKMENPIEKSHDEDSAGQIPLDLNYTSEGLDVKEHSISDNNNNNNPLQDVYDDVVNSDRDEDDDDDFFSSDDE